MSYSYYSGLVPVAAGAYAAGRSFRKWRRTRAAASMPAPRPKFRRSRTYRQVPKNFKKNLLALKESKFKDDDSEAFAPVSGTSVVTYISGIAQGDTDATRDGDTIYITSIQCKGVVSGDADQVVDRYAKFLLVKKKDVRGATITMTNLFKADHYNSMRNVDNSVNFQILKTWQRRIQVATTTGDAHSSRLDFFYKFKKPLRVKYLGTGNAVTDADRNGLFFIAMTSGGATDSPVTQIQYRITFKDV